MAKKKKPGTKEPATPAVDRARTTERPGAKRGQRIKVRARTDIYSDDNRYHRTGDVLHIDEHHFNERIHERVDPSTPTKITSSGAALRQAHDETLASRMQPGLDADIDNATGNGDPLGDKFASERD